LEQQTLRLLLKVPDQIVVLSQIDDPELLFQPAHSTPSSKLCVCQTASLANNIAKNSRGTPTVAWAIFQTCYFAIQIHCADSGYILY
tara:strand:- start:1228 stop:1488 length:261 start_codon:yes stop_codon:yes gene_type:complete